MRTKKKHYKTEIVLDEMIMLDSKGDNSGGSGNQNSGSYSSTKPAGKTNTAATDDDLPF